MTAHTVKIKDIGTIKELTFDLPDDSGGVLVLKGRNRTGKSTALRVLRALLSGNGRGLPVRDKAVRGSADAFGKHASVSSNVRLTGDLNVESLEGRLDFSDLVHPEAKDPETRDRIRIKALLSLTGAEADPSIFYELVGGQAAFEKLIPSESIKKKDLVELAGMVHRALHARAKEKESEADFAAGHAQSCREGAKGVISVETDDGKEVELTPLHRASNEAASVLATLCKQAEEAAELIPHRDESVKSLERVRECYDGRSIEDATLMYQEAQRLLAERTATVSELEAKLSAAKDGVKEAGLACQRAKDSIKIAEQHKSAVEAIERAIAEANRQIESAPSEGMIAAARHRALAAHDELEMGVKIRDAQQKLLQAKAHEDDRDKATAAALKLREAARSVDQVLSQKLPKGPLRAEAGRLVLDTERGEGAPFDECSAGEKWTYALPYGIGAVGAGGVLAVMQEAWDGLDDDNRIRVAEQAKGSRAWIITAEVDNGDLRAEVFQATEVTA